MTVDLLKAFFPSSKVALNLHDPSSWRHHGSADAAGKPCELGVRNMPCFRDQ
jgi:hypothetical protein